MAFDLQIFNKQTYFAMTEYMDQAVDKFNEASQGTIQLISKPFSGDFDIEASFKAIDGLVRRRNAHGSGAVAAKRLQQMLDVAVKVAAGTPPIRYEKQQYLWIQQNPELAALTIGEQLGKAKVADMLNAGILCGSAAIGSVVDLVEGDGTGDATFRLLNKGASRMGDRSGAIRAWVMHSTTMHNLFDNALANTENLFRYDGVNVIRDPFGRLFVVTDAPALAVTSTGTIYNTLGLVEGAVVVNDNNDFNAELNAITGGENIEYEYQAEWTYGVGVKGFAWDIAAGGKSPTDAAIGTSTNWDKIATSVKDTAGVLVKSK
ncbi:MULTISPECIES: major capsid protein [unclassified Acinetobacter]|uniref:major capsid protein n=1 Tax=unclassified Acinetobacter TaxID=196816 RepID=UPI0029344823|nr:MULTISPECIES: major capsid protein [unclassified Acinetobacter]WOE32756.1 major capsid protein [Acinetobacter sp. SAAs470]WOE38233.1 major capsid protein [Acinetobacter sp. SAAs474]